jgi:pimeloyl-ACP methyl ester carboxylesterase
MIRQAAKTFLHGCAVAVAALAIPTSAHPPGPATSTADMVPGDILSLGELRARYGDAQSRYVTVHGIELHYKDEGNGPVLLLLHGSQSSMRTYDRIAARLKDRYRIIRLDLPSYGLSSDVTDEAVANLKPVEIVEGFVDTLGLKQLSVAGVSSGGTMAAFLAAKRPELVTRLILSNMPSDRYSASHLVMPDSFLAAQKRFAASKRYDRNFWYEYLRYFAGDPARMTDAIIAEYDDFGRRADDPNRLALVAQVGDGIAAQSEFAKVTAPVLLIWGTADPLLPESAAKALAGHLPRAQVSQMLLADVGHYPPLEAPERFADIMALWIEQVAIAPRPAE